MNTEFSIKKKTATKKTNRRKEFFVPVQKLPRGFAMLWVYSLFLAFYSTYMVVLLQKATRAVELSDTHLFRETVVGMVILIVFNYLSKVIYKPTNFKLIRDAGNILDQRYFAKFISANNNETEKLGTGRLISIMQKWLYTRVDMLISLFRQNTMQVATVIASLYMLATKSLSFFLIGIGLVIILIPRVKFFSQKSIAWRKKSKENTVELDRMFVRRVMSKFEVQQQAKYEYEIQRRKELNNTWYRNKYTEKIRQAIAYDTVLFCSDILLVVVTIVVGLGVVKWSYLYSDLVLVTGLAMVLSRAMFTLQLDVRKSMDDFVHVEKLWDSFDQFAETQTFAGTKNFVFKKGDIHIHKLSYAYGKQKVLSWLELKIQGGRKTAFVWPSGWWKSTLIKLIAWYLSADQGDVYVDWQALKDLAIKSYYMHVGYLTQDPSIFDGTIRENLSYAISSNSVSDQEIASVIKAANCEFIYDFKAWLETEIGERWVRLSWGQRQRLAIAKIMLKNPEIILLDEPTSALDSFSEEAVTQAMNNLFKDRTVVVIAHRLQTVKSADDIIVLDAWKIIERGNHRQLVKLGGHYTKMLELQSGF